MARTRYGKTFTTKRGRRGRYKYVNNRRVGFVAAKRRRSGSMRKNYPSQFRRGRAQWRRNNRRRRY